MQSEIYNPKCESCKNLHKIEIRFSQNNKPDIFIKCLIDKDLFKQFNLGHYRDKNGKDHIIPNIIECSKYEKAT